ncbi:MAG TPA: aldolase/citrate lyase family protein [Nevskiaceae bacterium]
MEARQLRSEVRRRCLCGPFITIDASAVVELLGSCGFDYGIIDAEHSPLSIDRIAALLGAAAISGLPLLVRVPETGAYVGRVLDAGAAGVLAPRIESADAAAEVVSRARYVPEGARGLGPGRGGYHGGSMAGHMAAANAGVLVAVQIETRRGLDAVDEILSVRGVDAVVVGPADLAASLGVEMGSAEHTAACDRIIGAASRHGVAAGAFCMSADIARAYRARGLHLLIVGADSMFLADGATRVASALRGEE